MTEDDRAALFALVHRCDEVNRELAKLEQQELFEGSVEGCRVLYARQDALRAELKRVESVLDNDFQRRNPRE